MKAFAFYLSSMTLVTLSLDRCLAIAKPMASLKRTEKGSRLVVYLKTVSPKRVVTIVNSSAHFMTISGHFSANHIDIFEVKHFKMTTEPQFCERY